MFDIEELGRRFPGTPFLKQRKTKTKRSGRYIVTTTTYTATFNDHETADILVDNMPDVPDWVKEEWYGQDHSVRVAVKVEEEVAEGEEMLALMDNLKSGNATDLLINFYAHRNIQCTDEHKGDNPEVTALRKALQDAMAPKGAPRQKLSRRAGSEATPKACPPEQHSSGGTPCERKGSEDRTSKGSVFTPGKAIPHVRLKVVSVETQSMQ